MIYLVKYHTAGDRKVAEQDGHDVLLRGPQTRRVKASNATRAISTVVNHLKSVGEISSKADVTIREVTVVA